MVALPLPPPVTEQPPEVVITTGKPEEAVAATGKLSSANAIVGGAVVTVMLCAGSTVTTVEMSPPWQQLECETNVQVPGLVMVTLREMLLVEHQMPDILPELPVAQADPDQLRVISIAELAQVVAVTEDPTPTGFGVTVSVLSAQAPLAPKNTTSNSPAMRIACLKV